ncbi:MAG TPA: hypothetical protein ENI05_02620, partial [Porticoccus sp.]|nr:hypothetical protein [Porticoccus sp.]
MYLMLKKALALLGLTISMSANAVVQSTFNGVDYDWLELSHTQGLSREAVEERLHSANDVLYGYQYASRAQVEDLFLSYTSFDGIGGWHGNQDVVTGVTALIADFGQTYSDSSPGTRTTDTVDGLFVTYT